MNDNQIMDYMKRTGPNDISELLDIKQSQIIEKSLPVLNGLIYSKKELGQLIHKDSAL